MNTDQLQSYHAQQIKEYRNESINNHSQNRGKRVINTMTDYTYSDIFYNAIVEDDYHSKWKSFPQIIHNSCGKVLYNSGKG